MSFIDSLFCLRMRPIENEWNFSSVSGNLSVSIRGNQMKKQFIFVGLAVTLGLFSFQNCSQNNLSFKATEATSLGTIEDLGGSEPSVPTPEQPSTNQPSVVPVPVTVEEVADRCRSLAGLTTRRYAVNFPQAENVRGTNSVCAWNAAGNLERRNGFIQARHEQFVDTGIPVNAKVCSMSFQFPEQRMVYDDQIILTYRGVVLATSLREYWNRFNRAEGLPIYDWNQLRGQSSDVGGHSPTCLGGQTCIMPATQTTGAIRLVIPNEAFYQIATTMTGAPHTFSMITTADNDDSSDCKHSGVNFEVEVTYY